MAATRLPTLKHIPHEVWEDGTSRGIRIAQWEIETRKQAILNASEIDEATAKLDIPLPEITFGNNLVLLKRKGKQRALEIEQDDTATGMAEGTFSDFKSIVFDCQDALAQVDTTGEDTIKVSYADQWAKSRNLENAAGNYDSTSTSVIETVKDYDWTYSTTYSGTCEASSSFQPAPPQHGGIPLAKLARQDEPILFFDEVTLFEDELHDNGVANLTVRIRVMPSGMFILSRFFLRVDNVLFRIYDVRLYHDFSSGEIIRETKGKEAPYDAVKKRLSRERADDLTPLTDHNWVANILGMLENDTVPSTQARPLSEMSARIAPSVLPGATAHKAAPTAAPWARTPRQAVASNTNAMTASRPPDPESLLRDTAVPAKSRSNAYGAKRSWIGLKTRLEVLPLMQL